MVVKELSSFLPCWHSDIRLSTLIYCFVVCVFSGFHGPRDCKKDCVENPSLEATH